MSRTITSNMISFADLTDARQIDISIASNLPETQIYDQNEKKYSPDWSINPLILTPTVYMGSTNVSNPSSPSTTTYTWYRKYGGTGTEEQVSTNKVLTINANLSDSSGIVTYRCAVTYKANSSDTGVTSTKQIVFTRTMTGLNGSNGESASVTAQYSATGIAGSWHNALQNADAYIRFSYDNGTTWTTAWKIKGEDGTGVELKGTAYVNQTLPSNPIGTIVDDLFSDATKTNKINKAGLTDGDSYFVEGYLFTYSTQKFTCVGRIQGPKGIDGIPSYTHIKYADDNIGTNMGDAPIATTKWIGIKSTSSSVKPSSYTDYTWSKYVGEDAKSIVINASSQVFKIGSNNSTPVPATITVTGIASNTNITSWGYNTNGGSEFYPIVNVSGVAINGNQITITGKQLQSNVITFRATDGTNSDTLTIYKVSDGAIGTPGNPGQPASIAFLSNEHISFAANANGQISGQTVYVDVIAYTGNTKVLPTINTELGITGLPTGMTIGTIGTTEDNELKIPISITNNANLGSTGSINGELNIPILSPVQTVLKLMWSKINTGATGAARYLHIRYSNDGSTFTANNGQTVGAYMGQQVSTSSTASTNFNSYTWAKIQGSEGKGIGSIVEHYAVSASNTTAPTTWQTTVPTITVSNKYLWNYETITYTDSSTFDTAKRVIGVYGETGLKGESISIDTTSVTYLAGTSGTTKPSGAWSTTIPSVSEGSYLWTKTVVTYSDGTSTEAYSVAYEGINGTSVTISSTAVTYQVSTSGTTTPTGTWVNSVPSVPNGQFLWTKTVVTYSNNTSTTSYGVSYKGIDGNDAYTVILSNESHTFSGTTTAAIASSTKCEVFAYKGGTRVAATIGTISGLPTGMTAPITSNGTTSAYFSPTVTTSMTTASGVLTIPITVDGKSFSKTFSYALSLKGNTGNGVTSIVEEYYLSTSSTSQSGGSWVTTSPTWVDGKFIWTRSKITYTDGNATTTSPICVTGGKGSTGNGISKVDVQYYKSTSATSLAGGSWSTTAPTWSDNTYMWSKTVTTYTNGSTAESTPACITGAKGTTGTPASLVDIRPSALFFKSTTGDQGPFTPEYIYLYPSFQTVTFSKWQYSINGGTTWVDAAGANGLTIGKYDNIDNTLRIARTSTLYTSSITSISFRCNSSSAAIFDTVSVAKIYDVVDLQIGGRNLIPSKILYNGTWNTKDFTASAWALTVINETELRKILEPSTTYTMSYFAQLIQRTTVPTPYSYQVGFLFYSPSTSSANRETRSNNFKELNQSKQFTSTFITPSQIPDDYRLLLYTNRYTTNGGDPIGLDTVRFTNLKLEKGNKQTDYTPAPEDVDDKIDTASGIVAMLSNEAHFFVANASGVPTATSTVLDVVGYKGSIQQNTTVGTITGLPSAGMTATISNNGTQNTKITVAVTTALTSAVADSGVLTIPITIAGKTINKLFSWSKSKDGVAAKLISLSASGQIFKVAANGTVTPSTLTVSAEVQNTTASTWTYSVNGGAFSSTAPAGVSRSGNTVTITGSTMTANSITVKASDGTNSDVMTVVKVSDGSSVTVSSTSVTYQVGTSGTTKPTGTWSTTIPSVNDESYLWTKTVVSYSDGKSTEAYSVSYKSKNGTNVTISSTSVTYQASASGTSAPTGTWNTTIPSVSEGQFLWTRTIVTYSNSTSTTSYSVSYQGKTGNGISSIVNYYLATDSSSGVTTSTTGWTTAIQTTTASKRYLWNYEIINYTNGTKNTSSTRIIGTHGTNAVSFTIYAPNGYLLSSDLTSLTLQTFAYDGATAITSGATYKWYEWINEAWSVISGATSASLNVSQSDVLNSKTYKCEMTYKGVVYIATETVEDKGDTYNAMICTVSSDIISSANRFLIVYVLTYNHSGEVDALLGPISRVAPANPVSGDYWYSIDASAETVTLKKYNGTAWVDSTDLQELTYDWNIGGVGKVKVIKKSDISVATNLQCEVVSDTLDVIARCNQLLYDTNDPIVSDTEPSEKFDGQIWIKKYDNGTFSMYTWSAADNQWIMSETDSRQKIFTKKPSNYQMGDLWLVGSDYAPSGFATGVLLKAQNANLTYSDSNWVDETMYARRLAELEGSVERYNQFFDFTAENGLKIRARDSNNNPSKFYTQLTNSELGFYQDNDKVAYINDHKMNITEADINIVETPMLKIGNFAFIVESNGSMSIVRNQ